MIRGFHARPPNACISRTIRTFRGSEIGTSRVRSSMRQWRRVVGFSLRLSRGFRALRLWSFDETACDRARRNERGSAAVEFAIIGPVLILMMLGIFTYGGYFLTAHTIQQITNDAARAAIAGLDDAERAQLARDAFTAGLLQQDFLRGEVNAFDVATRDGLLSVRVTYDASEDVYWSFESLLPVPTPTITRAASIRLGGM